MNKKYFFQEYALADRIMLNSRVIELLASMPKDEATLQDIGKMWMEKRTVRFLVQPSKVYCQVGTYLVWKSVTFVSYRCWAVVVIEAPHLS